MTGAFDIGGTKTAVGIVLPDGECVWSKEIPTAPSRGPEAAVRDMAALLRLGQNEVRGRVTCAGVGCTGPVDPLSGVVGDVDLLPGWNGFPLARALGDALEVPVRVENDCDAAALAEWRFGAGRGTNRFLFVSISTGIGVGFVEDGRIYRGVGGAHPEMGHHAIDLSGPECYCGARGCWESLASGSALARAYSAKRPELSACDATVVFRDALAGHAAAQRVLADFTEALGAGLGNLITLFAPDAIAVGGGVMGSAAHFFERACLRARQRARLVPQQALAIVPAALGRRAGLIGAACVAV